MEPITDLACEILRRTPHKITGVTTSTTNQSGINIQTTVITSISAARSIGKPIGTYINLDTTKSSPSKIIHALHQALSPLITNKDKILIIGLGNDKFVADSLGPSVLRNIKTNKQLLTFEPSVFGVTGINSVDAIKAITRLVRPTTVIVIDSLVSATPARIGTNYQICTSGITPGSGIGRDNKTIDHKLLGVPVIAVGVPVCTIMTPAERQLYHVVPKDIDVVIRDCAQIIARSLNTLELQN